jgi:hypothetical protein
MRFFEKRNYPDCPCETYWRLATIRLLRQDFCRRHGGRNSWVLRAGKLVVSWNRAV